MPFFNESISGVVCGASFNEFSSPQKVLAEFQRVIKPGARAHIMFQVLSRHRVTAAAQRALGSLSGLQFPTVDEARERLSRQFHLKVLVQDGLLLIARLSVSGSRKAACGEESCSNAPAMELFSRSMEQSVESQEPA
jgi:ubiquinone/menaquinone biosynthesis C-methylase UbiE